MLKNKYKHLFCDINIAHEQMFVNRKSNKGSNKFIIYKKA